MRRFSAILLLLAVSALGTGVLRFVHDRAHTLEDRHAHAGALAAEAKNHPDHSAGHAGTHAAGHSEGHTPGQTPAVPHDESNCLTHAQLKLSMVGAGFVPVLVCLGVFVAFLTLLHTPVRSRRPTLLLDSRSPPARLSFQPA